MKTTPAYTCICQDCNKVFIIDEVMVNVINLDDDKDITIDFFSSSLNRISCPYCEANFTYEIPMLIFSTKDKFAIKVDPHSAALINSPPNMLPDFFKAFSFRYRQVTYHIEALEKARIFKDGLDDKYIEYVKLRFFPDADATPMEDINLCYKASDSKKLYFEKLDYNGNLIKEFEVLKSDIKKCSFCHSTSHLLWHKINRYTIENLIIKEEETMSTLKNALVGQSGGPTTVINSSLAGVISEYLSTENCGTIYGAVNGIKGILRGDIIELNSTFSDENNINLLKQTPSSYLGSCRYRLKKDNDDEIKQIVSFLKEKDIGYFFYIGGNDSMDTVMRMAPICTEHDIKVIGVPKTIDNDLMGTDHSPGFGSCAKYISTVVSQMAQDAGCYDIKNVLIVEIMGRNAGWLAAASALARGEKLSAPDLIYLPERPFDEERFLFDIRQKLLNQDTVIVAVSEGIRFADGTYVAQDCSDSKKDMFGHGQLGGTGKKLEYLVKSRLGIKVRSVELNIQQRCATHIASLTDVDEAFECGAEAVKAAFSGKSGKMIAMVRKDSDKYEISYEALDINSIANGEKTIPDTFINHAGNDVTDEFIKYAKPLISGERSITYKNGIPDYIVR